MSIYRELVDSSRSQAVARSRELGLLEDYPVFHPIWAVELALARGGLVPQGDSRDTGQSPRLVNRSRK